MRGMIEVYNGETEKFRNARAGKTKETQPKLEDVVDFDPRKISWSRGLKADAERGKRHDFDEKSIVQGMYRPFTKQWVYFNRGLNGMVLLMPRLFPTQRHRNVIIAVIGVADRKGFSCFVTDHLPNLHLMDTGQCFPTSLREDCR